MFPGAFEIDETEIEAVRRSLSHEAFVRYEEELSYPSVLEFEAAFSTHLGGVKALGVSSGTAALVCALTALGIGPGDEVAVPAYTFVATANAVVAVGAMPVVVDVDRSLTIDPSALARRVGPETRAVIPVHMRGMPARMDGVLAEASQLGLFVIEDASQACGGSFRDVALGAHGDMGCFSLQARKIITVGEGGVVVTSDDTLLARARYAHDGASAWRGAAGPDPNPRVATFPGVNMRMSPVAGALGQVQLGRLDDVVRRMRDHKARLSHVVSDLPRVEVQESTDPGDVGVALIFFARTPAVAADIAVSLVAEGVAARVLRETTPDWHVAFDWRDIQERYSWHHTGYPFACASRDIRNDASSCPVAADLLTRAVHLNIPPQLTDTDVVETCDALEKVIGARA
jgi:dTDP-4-amino-4,6-dideoxygalactose transaminase